MSAQLEDLRAKYRALINSVEWAYAMGAGCGNSSGHPTYAAIRQRGDDLLTRIRALEHLEGMRPMNDPDAPAIEYEFCSN